MAVLLIASSILAVSDPDGVRLYLVLAVAFVEVLAGARFEYVRCSMRAARLWAGRHFH